MSTKIVINFECIACAEKTGHELIKPNFFKPSMLTTTCKICDTHQLTKVIMKAGSSIGVDVLEIDFSEKGLEIYNKRTDENKRDIKFTDGLQNENPS